jgi:YggT family protein
MSDHQRVLLANFVTYFGDLYILLILVYILQSFVTLPYNRWLYAIRDFASETVWPLLSFFRRLLPMFGPLDLSPMLAMIAVIAVQRIAQSIILG